MGELGPDRLKPVLPCNAVDRVACAEGGEHLGVGGECGFVWVCGGSGGADAGNGGFADNVVNSALRFRAQAPIVDQLLREIGLQGGDIGRLVAGASGATAALPPASAPMNTSASAPAGD